MAHSFFNPLSTASRWAFSGLSAYAERSQTTNSAKRFWTKAIAWVLVLACILSAIATYAAFADVAPFNENPNTVIWLLNLDLILLLALGGILAKRIVSLWSDVKEG